MPARHFSLIRFETNREPVWFKAVGKPNIREWAVTLALAGLCPDCVPQSWPVQRRWNASLALQAPANPWLPMVNHRFGKEPLRAWRAFKSRP